MGEKKQEKNFNFLNVNRMLKLDIKELITANVHLGHYTNEWCPFMKPFIYSKKKGIHIINLHKTISKLNRYCNLIKDIVASGKKILFIATKKQAKFIVEETSKKYNMPYITERWLGGLLTNFTTFHKSICKLNTLEREKKTGTYNSLSKKELLSLHRIKKKLEENVGSISAMNSLPEAIFIVDIVCENIALKEAKKLKIPVFGLIDTNSDPRKVDYPIPANDDSSKSIEIIFHYINESLSEGLKLRENV
ncbi:30S ribosomal protein S2 [Candidatus Uzinura diaspidicola str. ASNER]|uniref:Small ribosomal subunit protein uS2 n=4 Tax=Candidatus Uzinura diaspidicola TaxID=670956 RepID=L7VG15_9FLAO|nr:30S ribosomal protein S2 [Candidatus Uzinura diaspidicola str. ASNER]